MAAAFRLLGSALRRQFSVPHLRTVVGLLFTLLAVGVTSSYAQEVVEYYATDAVGSIRVVFDPSGNVLAKSDYLPFGDEWQPATPGGPLPSRRFTGQQRDAEEGVDYFHARNYQVRHARFDRPDPIFAGLFAPQSWNRYAYALNNPLSFIDPTGLNYECVETQRGVECRESTAVTGRAPGPYGSGNGGGVGSGGNSGSGSSGTGRECTARTCEAANGGRREPRGSQSGGDVSSEVISRVNPRTDVITIAQPTTNAVGTGAVNGLVDFSGGVALGGLLNRALRWFNGPVITNPVPATVARVIPAGVRVADTLGRRGEIDVFVTAAEDIAGMTGSEIAKRLTIRDNPAGFEIIEFLTPEGIASPILRGNQGFVGGGLTRGGAREFVVPNGPIPPGANIRIVP